MKQAMDLGPERAAVVGTHSDQPVSHREGAVPGRRATLDNGGDENTVLEADPTV